MSTQTHPIPDPSCGIMNYNQLSENRYNLEGRLVRVIDLRGVGRYWKTNYDGYTNDPSEAGKFTIAKLIADHLDNGVVFELVDDEIRPAERKEFVHLTLPQVVSNLNNIGAKICRIVNASEDGITTGRYWKKPLGSGVTWLADQALEMRLTTVASQFPNYQHIKIEMLDQEVAGEISKLPFRKCSLKNHVHGSLITGLTLQPSNPTYRAMLLKTFGVMPPADITTFGALLDWIEFNCDPPNVHPIHQQPEPATNYAGDFYVRLTFTDTEVGRCNYSVVRGAEGTYRFSVEEMSEIVRASGSFRALMQAIHDRLQQNAWNCDPPMADGYGDYDCDNHHMDEVRRGNWSHRDSISRQENNLKDFLHATLPREELVRLGLAPALPTPQHFPDLEEPFPITTRRV